jgi:cytidylate kinase
MPVITISRQVGSGGMEIATQVCTRLGYRYLDKWLLMKTASDVGLSEHEVVDFSEDHYQARSFLEVLLGPRNRVVSSVATRQRGSAGEDQFTIAKLDEAQCINLVRTAVLAAHKQGDTVIAGRGGQAILSDRLDVLHVRIEAPVEQRIRHLRDSERLGEMEARAYLAERDRAAAQYLDRFFGIRWDDPLNYNLVINTGRWDIDAAVEIIAHAVGQLQTVRHPTQPLDAVPD